MKKNEKGFALVLSLILLLVMSIMGGTLIVIATGDIERNASNDQYQQTFYVAETGLIEGERYLQDLFKGPWDTNTDARNDSARGLPLNDNDVWNGIMGDTGDAGVVGSRENYIETDTFVEINTADMCFNSFRNIDKNTFKLILDEGREDPPASGNFASVAHSWNFGELIRDIYVANGNLDADIEEAEALQNYYYEYFITRVGSASYRGTGGSVKKKASDTGLDGMAYRIYACGIFQGAERMVVPLESLYILPK